MAWRSFMSGKDGPPMPNSRYCKTNMYLQAHLGGHALRLAGGTLAWRRELRGHRESTMILLMATHLYYLLYTLQI
jgi:hypothetical protein